MSTSKNIIKKTITNPKTKLSKYFYKFLETFNKVKANKFPPFQSDIDIQIKLEKDKYRKRNNHHGDPYIIY